MRAAWRYAGEAGRRGTIAAHCGPPLRPLHTDGWRERVRRGAAESSRRARLPRTALRHPRDGVRRSIRGHGAGAAARVLGRSCDGAAHARGDTGRGQTRRHARGGQRAARRTRQGGRAVRAPAVRHEGLAAARGRARGRAGPEGAHERARTRVERAGGQGVGLGRTRPSEHAAAPRAPGRPRSRSSSRAASAAPTMLEESLDGADDATGMPTDRAGRLRLHSSAPPAPQDRARHGVRARRSTSMTVGKRSRRAACS